MMFKYTKKIVTAASVLAFCSGQLYAMNPDRTDDEDKQPNRTAVVARIETPDPRFKDELPIEIMRLIFAEACKGKNPTNPRRIAAVCNFWNNVMREDSPVNKMGVPYANLNPFMQKCMNMYWESRFYYGVLDYARPQNGAVRELRFSDLDEPFKGKFNLQGCRNIADEMVITTDPVQFFKVRGENEDRIVILIALRHLLAQEINSAEHPFAQIMAGWNGDNAPAGIFWRYGNHENATQFDYLTVSSLAGISTVNLFENWKKAAPNDAEQAIDTARERAWRRNKGRICDFHVYFKPKLVL